MFENKTLDFSSDEILSKYFASVINALPPYIYSFTYGDQKGDFYGARRTENGDTQFYKSNASTEGHSFYYDLNADYSIKGFNFDFGPFDPRTREWYTSALLQSSVNYSSIYEHFVMKDMTLSASKKIEVDGAVDGVLGVHLTLSLISDHLKKITENTFSTVYIINNDSDKLVASNNDKPNFIELDGNSIRAMYVHEIDDSIVQNAFDTQARSTSIKNLKGDKIRVSSTSYTNDKVDFQIITLIPETPFISHLSKSIYIFFVSAISLLSIGIFIWFKVTAVMLKPIDALIHSTIEFSKGNRHFDISPSVIEEVDQLSSAFINMVHTISDNMDHLEQMNTDYNLAKLEAENASKSKSLFLANMSHEIRTPMNGIIALTEVMNETCLDKNQKEMLNIIRSSAGLLLEIINDILDISKIEAGKLEVEPVVTDLRAILEQEKILFSNLAEKKHLIFNLDISKDLPAYVLVDAGKLNQIIINLLGNAVKFTDTGEINLQVISSDIDERRVLLVIEIKDTGVGINPEEIDTIFDLFVQSDMTKDKRSKGTGLGLAIVKQLVQLLNGTISVKSIPDVGSVFTVSLVVQRVHQDAKEEINYKRSMDQLSFSSKVLLVEDDTTSQFVIQKIAEINNWNLSVVSSGAEAMDFLSQNTIDVILMDVQMPEMNGIKLTQWIREKEQALEKKAYIIGVSAYAMQSDIKEALDAGMDDYMSKPIDYQKLKKLLNDLLFKA